MEYDTKKIPNLYYYNIGNLERTIGELKTFEENVRKGEFVDSWGKLIAEWIDTINSAIDFMKSLNKYVKNNIDYYQQNPKIMEDLFGLLDDIISRLEITIVGMIRIMVAWGDEKTDEMNIFLLLPEPKGPFLVNYLNHLFKIDDTLARVQQSYINERIMRSVVFNPTKNFILQRLEVYEILHKYEEWSNARV